MSDGEPGRMTESAPQWSRLEVWGQLKVCNLLYGRDRSQTWGSQPSLKVEVAL